MLPVSYDALMMLLVLVAITGQVLAQDASVWDLAPMIAAFVVPIVGLTVTLMRYQHLDSTKTRDLIERTAKETAKETAKQFERAAKETAKQFERAAKETAKQFEETAKETAKQFERASEEFDLLRADVTDIGRSLSDARERLAHIEGRLDTIRPQHDDDGTTSRDAA